MATSRRAFLGGGLLVLAGCAGGKAPAVLAPATAPEPTSLINSRAVTPQPRDFRVLPSVQKTVGFDMYDPSDPRMRIAKEVFFQRFPEGMIPVDKSGKPITDYLPFEAYLTEIGADGKDNNHFNRFIDPATNTERLQPQFGGQPHVYNSFGRQQVPVNNLRVNVTRTGAQGVYTVERALPQLADIAIALPFPDEKEHRFIKLVDVSGNTARGLHLPSEALELYLMAFPGPEAPESERLNVVSKGSGRPVNLVGKLYVATPTALAEAPKPTPTRPAQPAVYI